ncbi:MAG TPA: enoyl-CoA-hydratase DpgB [Streptosporangiaceae bacterium]|nr:enoyl-CoA-hydratase DpgB [Streptosporangiaceae bacterium]
MSDKNATTGGSPYRLWIDSGQPLTQELIASVNRVCDRLEDARDNRVAVFELVSGTSEPGAWPGEVGIHSVNRWERAVRRLERLDAPTVAVVQGRCSGAALELMLAIDYRIATPSSRFEFERQSGIVWPSMTLYRLVQQTGLARARKLALFGGVLTAEEAQAFDLIDEVAENPGETLTWILDRLATMTSSEVRIRRQLVLEAVTVSYEDAIGVHLSACDRALRHYDKEAVGLI